MKETKVKLFDYNIQLNGNNALNNYINTQNGYIPPNIAMINPFSLWQQGYTGKDVKVAIIDSGYSKHSDLDMNIIGGRTFTKEDNGNPNIYNDYNGHSTHICGVICANGHIKGIAPNSKLLILKVLEGNGNGNLESVYNAINYAIDQKVNIMNVSLGCPSDVTELHNAIKRAVNNNIIVCCAIGNSGDNNANTNEIDYPAYYPEVVSVGAIDNSRISATFSNSNIFCDIVAPGVNIVSTHLNNGYIGLDGTSMSTPHVVGAIALLIERFRKVYNREPSYMEIYAQLIKNTIDLGIDAKIQGNGSLFLR